MLDSIFAGNLNGSVGMDVYGAFTSLGHNLIGSGTGSSGFVNGRNGDLVGTSTSRIDPKLGPLQNNGGPTETMALLSGSRAIGAGTATGTSTVTVPAQDQRGNSRHNPPDIGAYDLGSA